MSKFVHGWDLLTGGEVQMGKISLAGQKHTLAGHRGPFFLLAGQMYYVPIYHLLPISRGPFFFARGPFMARGLLFEKHWCRPFERVQLLRFALIILRVLVLNLDG